MKQVSIILDENDYQKLSSFIKSLPSAHIKESQIVEIEKEETIILSSKRENGKPRK